MSGNVAPTHTDAMKEMDRRSRSLNPEYDRILYFLSEYTDGRS